MATGKVSSFRGLNNVTDSVRLGLEWLTQADNVDITETGAIKQRTGYTRALAGAFTAAYATLDFQRMFVVDGGTLKAMTGPAAAVSLLAGISPAPMHFTEINQQTFFNNGAERGVILPDNTLLGWDWPMPDAPTVAAVTGNLPAGLYRVCCTFLMRDGRETGSSEAAEIVLGAGQALQITAIPQRAGIKTLVYVAPADSTVFQHAATPAGTAVVWNTSPDTLGVDLTTDGLDPLPLGADIIQAWKGRIYAAHYLPTEDQTVVWFSKPLGFHLFDLAADFFMVPGRVLMLAPHDDALIVGTDKAVYAYTAEGIAPLASYGVVPGWHWSTDEARTLFWTTRGLCAALPFSNLTERQISVAPGLCAGGALVQDQGRKRYLVALQQGGSAFNPLV